VASVDAPVSGSGIFGGGKNAFAFTGNNSNNYLYNATLMDLGYSAWALDFWAEPIVNSGSSNYLFYKKNAANEYFSVFTEASGNIMTCVVQVTNTTTYRVSSPVTLTTGTTGFHHYSINYDTANGLRMWCDAVLVASQSATGTQQAQQITAGTTTDFFIGAHSTSASALCFDGRVSIIRLRNKVLTQKDVDVAYATKYTRPTTPVGLEVDIRAQKYPGGCADVVTQYPIQDYEVARTSAVFYRAGGVVTDLSADDRIKIFVRS